MERYSKVGMQELDQRLSKIVEAARKKPVSVYRYGAPWVWIVSQDDWQGALKEVSSYIPAGHSLVLLRPQIDDVLEQYRDWLQPEPGMLIAPHTVVHILLLQLLYSVPSEQQLHEQLNYNLLFRWFVGLDLTQKVWSLHALQRDIASLLNNPQAVQLIQKIIGEVFCGALLHMPEFSLNFALLHTWLARHSHLSTTSN
ncbi:transposase [Pseudomonas edaphica]|jgi:transposase|uniref:Transposase n=1 Tax=Pseudomonas edaphica TaxID=2006980 RepID=A0A5R8QU74_9PSED|nr:MULTISPECIES: transposase [Pseudomonas]MCF5230298.1 transposase [Pseudomonas sp. PA-5-4H]MCF5239707.1 transposase [Pseudomonas sp. PA-5-4G]MCF5249767.1 transposase [Pseudomonas sp. PA-5-4B]MCF5257541.1 transposase [Pseudomonas sp. PA-5-4B]MCF5259829.1 transposase [Pseudomonas sp. PA-5-4A]